MDQIGNLVGSVFQLAWQGLWHFKEYPIVFVPLYIWIAYGCLSCWTIGGEEQLAGFRHLKKASIAAFITSLVVPLIPIAWFVALLITFCLTMVSIFTARGPFMFLKWRPFDLE